MMLPPIYFSNMTRCITSFSSREALVSSFNSLGFLGAPLEPAAGILTSYHQRTVRLEFITIINDTK